MANAKKCDRCGILYDTPNVKGKLEKITCTLNFSVIGISIEGSHNTVSFDLCNACAKEYMNFLKGANENERK